MRADTIYLKNGKSLEGRVTRMEAAGQVRIEVEEGPTVEIALSEVDRIEEGPTRGERIAADLESLREKDPEDIDGLITLAKRARRADLQRKAREIYELVLDLDPHHEQARSALGFVVHRNRWVSRKTLKESSRLLEHEGMFVTREEKERLEIEALVRRVGQMLEGVESENRDIQAFSIDRLQRLRAPGLREALLRFLGHEHESVRVVASQVLAERQREFEDRRELSSGRGRKVEAAARKAAEEFDRKLGRALVQRVLVESAPVGRKALLLALARMRHRVFFDQALERMTREPDADLRRRLAEGILFALRKAWMRDLIASLGKVPPGARTAGHPEILSILRRISREDDFGYDVEAWRRWWSRNAGFFHDDDS